MGSHSLLYGLFPNQRLNLGFMHCRHILYHMNHQGSPVKSKWTFLSFGIWCCETYIPKYPFSQQRYFRDQRNHISYILPNVLKKKKKAYAKNSHMLLETDIFAENQTVEAKHLFH